jgi:hypothetical protein
MRRMLLAVCLGACALMVSACGPQSGTENDGNLEVRWGAHDAWPATVNSARIAMSRTGGTTGCGTAAATLSRCWCRTAGAGCDFSGDPPPNGTVNLLCSGDWTLNTATSAAFTATACLAGTELVTTESSTPATVAIPYGGTATVNVIFQATSGLDVDVQFDG